MKRSLNTILAVALFLVAGGILVSSILKMRREQREALGTPEPPRAFSRQATLQDPQARQALTLVGADARAEEIWVAAINNPALNAHERQDLIEDLNEEGFADPKHLTPADLPLIENRLRLIERLAPLAMDQVNADAFQEAYKDLTAMRARLQAQAAPAAQAR